MNDEFIHHADTGYRLAEEKAARYFASLYAQVMDRRYVSTLTEDIRLWRRGRASRRSWLPFITPKKRKPDSRDYHRYIGWLEYTGNLDAYLDRSVSYIYMRDLGQVLDSPDTQARIRHIAGFIKGNLTHFISSKKGEQPEFMSLAGAYRWAQREGIETTVIWLINKLKSVASHLPEELNAEQAQRKLMKIILGVILHVNEDMNDQTPPEERTRRLDEAIRLGYSYGLTYPFIDDLLDSKVLTAQEKEQYSLMIRTTLLTGSVPEMGEWSGRNMDLLRYVHTELREAFEYIKSHQRAETHHTFFEQAYVFFQSQELDRQKDISDAAYTNEELYIPIILKSSSSRLIARSVISAPVDEGFDDRTFYYGIYNQLADDFADMLDDMRDGAVTPYTYYLKYHKQRSDLVNPFELYWTVISHLIHNVYHSDAKTREVILGRAINGLKRYRERVGTDKYQEIMGIFASGNAEFARLIKQIVRKTDDVDFFDKLLRDQVVTILRNDREEQERFTETIETVRREINSTLPIPKQDGVQAVKEPIIEAANYSLEGDGKRLRPILVWAMGVNEYGLDSSAILPLMRSLEYMHTASLIFDDLPSQDNASTRRGRLTLHQMRDTATAELTGLYLIQKGVQEQASLHQFRAETVLALIRYSAEKAEDLCMGQLMDLQARGQALTLEQLNTISFYKTGVAFEASLVMPAILAEAAEAEIAGLKKFAYHAGIAFQIKDDLLDLEGDALLIGKPVGKDAENNSSTFVSILGQEGAAKAMWDHYCLALDAVKGIPRSMTFLKHLLNYIVHRDK
ncbi:polyprenyl synthetase family protein [Paenibacillus sp. YPG26]|uniref:polyprenyl synthetase family protein n=1 Tax=Paenibacillus sp. YPG26 TaxID=2878915 RepID=UPI00203DF453|nr:polyprenyl synthetase family protein [Paenibacillus sp. YPG26]USB33529.1 polyprenyl synthetase family protein [Paenibacillus sp. YPG26]